MPRSLALSFGEKSLMNSWSSQWLYIGATERSPDSGCWPRLVRYLAHFCLTLIASWLTPGTSLSL